MVKEFDEACQTAEIGKLVGPVKTQFGYHLIRVEAKKDAGSVPFAEVKDQIRQKLLPEKQKQAFEAFVESLKKTIPVKELYKEL